MLPTLARRSLATPNSVHRESTNDSCESAVRGVPSKCHTRSTNTCTTVQLDNTRNSAQRTLPRAQRNAFTNDRLTNDDSDDDDEVDDDDDDDEDDDVGVIIIIVVDDDIVVSTVSSVAFNIVIRVLLWCETAPLSTSS
jgi:hypothetical protein